MVGTMKATSPSASEEASSYAASPPPHPVPVLITLGNIFTDLERISRWKVIVDEEKRKFLDIDKPIKEVSELVLDPTFNDFIPGAYLKVIRSAEAIVKKHEPSSPSEFRLATEYLKNKTLVGYLLYSPTFRQAIETRTQRGFQPLITLATLHQGSIIAFCRIRWLINRTTTCSQDPIMQSFYETNSPEISEDELYDDIRQMPEGLPAHPHEVVIIPGADGSVQLLRHEVEIGNHVKFNAGCFSKGGRPKSWPRDWPHFPMHPQALRVREKRRCKFCKNLYCRCDPAEKMPVPCLDLYAYYKMGVGVRSLQYITPGTSLSEYIGNVVHLNDSSDSDYSMEVNADFLYRAEDSTRVVARIDSYFYGNWTRFLNHSCSPNAEYQRAVIGTRVHIIVVSLREIFPFEQITVDYGNNYFNLEEPVLLCECGNSNCRYDTVEKIGEELSRTADCKGKSRAT